MSKTADEMLRDSLLKEEETGKKLSRQERRFLERQMDKAGTRWECPFCHNVEYGGVVAHIRTFVDEKTEKEYTQRFPRRCSQCGSNMIKTKKRLRRKRK